MTAEDVAENLAAATDHVFGEDADFNPVETNAVGSQYYLRLPNGEEFRVRVDRVR
jgi:hypothetical protein